MGYLYEIAVTPYVFARKHFGSAPRGSHSFSTGSEQRIRYGTHRQQRFSYWEPVAHTPGVAPHQTVVLYFHGGAFIFGESESMADAADVYNARGYRFCSIGWREWPFARFPAQVDDAFAGVKAAVTWLEARGVDCSRIVIGGTSAGGMLAYLMVYSHELQRRYGLEDIARRIVGCVSIAGVSDAADMLLKPFVGYHAWRVCVNIPCEGHGRDDMRRALAPYSPVEVVAHEVSGRPVDETREPGIPCVPAFIMHGRADTLAPFSSQVRFVELLREVLAQQAGDANDSTVTFRVLENRKWQHMFLTVSLHRRDPEGFAPLKELFAWLDGIDGSQT